MLVVHSLLTARCFILQAGSHLESVLQYFKLSRIAVKLPFRRSMTHCFFEYYLYQSTKPIITLNGQYVQLHWILAERRTLTGRCV